MFGGDALDEVHRMKFKSVKGEWHRMSNHLSLGGAQRSGRKTWRALTMVGGLLGSSVVLAAAGGASIAASASSTPKLSGKPVIIGLINQENTPAGSFPEIRQGAQAAVAYINKTGGIKGHQLVLKTCVTDGSPAASASCANTMVADKAIAVSIGIDFGTSGSLPVLTKAGIPMIGGDPLLSPELTSTNAIFFAGGSADAFPDQDKYIGTVLHAQKVSIIYTNNPAGTAAATTFGQDLLVKAGVPASGIKLIGAAADATDFTPAVTAAAANNPDVIMVLFAALGCSRIMQAKQSLGVTAKMFYPGSCLDKSVIQAGGAGANGGLFNSEWVPYNNLGDPQVALYRQLMTAKYGNAAIISGYSQLGFQSDMNIAEVLNKMGNPANLTGKSVLRKFKTLTNEPNFMGHNYNCKKPGVAIFPSVCNYQNRIVQYVKGNVKDVYGKWISGAALLG